jgi:lipopolysaccharide biosynthesis regulator YciM
MQALQESVYGENPILLRVKRNQIAAEAMMKLGRPDEALATLGQDDSGQAERIRAMIYWNEKDWQNVINSVENMLKGRPDPSKELSFEESEFVLRLALAYVFENDIAQLQYMRDYFTPLLRNSPNFQAFEFITTPDIQLNTRNFDDLLVALSKTKDFVDNYTAQVSIP